MHLKCKKCECSYQKPSIYEEYLVQSNYNIFYQWSLIYCDKCRKEKEHSVLNELEEVTNILAKSK